MIAKKRFSSSLIKIRFDSTVLVVIHSSIHHPPPFPSSSLRSIQKMSDAKHGNAKALEVSKGALIFVDETSTFTDDSGTFKFPCAGVVDDTGKFRQLTPAEKEEYDVDEKLYAEAKSVGSTVSLRVRPGTTERLLFLEDAHTSVILKSEYKPGSATEVSAEELKLNPFNGTGLINKMHVDQGGKTTGMLIGDSGEFRLRVKGSKKVWNVKFNYGYVTKGPNSLNVDGRVFVFD